MSNVIGNRSDDQPESSSGEAAESRDIFANISDEVILNILSFLKHSDLTLGIGLANRRFRNLVMDPGLWTHLTLPLQENLGSIEAASILKRCNGLLRCLSTSLLM
jgi:hypothetical protein